jgi:NADH-quinone oxidoreductase subunit M
VVGIIYGALVAMVQPDLKRIVAYSSVSHLGFVMLGIFALNPQGVEGAVYQMLNHGVSTGALFLMVGMIYVRRHTREVSEFGGLWKTIPMFAALFMIVMLSSIGLPGLNGFVGEFLILLGTFLHSQPAAWVAVIGLVLGALYMMWAYERVMWGPVTKTINQTIKDLSGREIAVMVPLVALMLLMGLYPRPLLSRMEPSVNALLDRVQAARARLDASHARTLAALAAPARNLGDK